MLLFFLSEVTISDFKKLETQSGKEKKRTRKGVKEKREKTISNPMRNTIQNGRRKILKPSSWMGLYIKLSYSILRNLPAFN